MINFRIYFFIVLSTILIIAEFFSPYRKRVFPRLVRWPSNLMLVISDNVLLKLILPTGLLGVSSWAQTRGIGLFNILEINCSIINILSIVVLDLAIYLQHLYSHKWKWLWIFHRVHHSDPDLDVTSALRFHPIEIAYSAVYKIGLILFFGIRPEAVLTFEIILNSMAMFNHSNVLIPDKFEKLLRMFFVTPQMHIIHHSVVKNETDSNYGFNFSCWDFLFKTYNSVFLSDGVIGQQFLKSRKDQQFLRLIIQPWKEK
jgi:sterol desaturase/sphingolipid hydroxylase (fatty acid hydroxylase superfamily)